MPLYKKESLETLRQRIDLVDVLSSHMDLKRAGAAYKGLCPFHDEKTPSFVVQKGDTHYHCFGCGAHGDAIHFLMSHLRMSFSDSIENLAQRYQVNLEIVDSIDEKKGYSKTQLRDALELATRFYHFMLLHTAEGHEALQYLYSRGLDLDFIRHFKVGLAPRQPGLFRTFMRAKSVSEEAMLEAGLLTEGREGRNREFFYDRIMFPIHSPSDTVIGFSGRKYKEATTGGKYVNTQETSLFKKSRVLFGLNYCRKRIAKERRAIIVEGQIDALRLIQEGFDLTVAGQGTAFGEGHVKELTTLGINQVYLALDADTAGQDACYKIGNLFQRIGVEVRVVEMPAGSDPDAYLREHGPQAFLELVHQSVDYLTFVVKYQSKRLNINSPAGKNEIVQVLSKQIRDWEQPLMVHESLRKLSHLLQIPENMMGIGQEAVRNFYLKRSDSIGMQTVDPDRILETDLLRWLIMLGNTHEGILAFARLNIKKEDFCDPMCSQVYQTILTLQEKGESFDSMALRINTPNPEAAQLLIQEIHSKKVNLEKANSHIVETVKRLLERNWMRRREEVKTKIHSGECPDEEAIALAKLFDEIKKTPPSVKGVEQLT